MHSVDHRSDCIFCAVWSWSYLSTISASCVNLTLVRKESTILKAPCSNWSILLVMVCCTHVVQMPYFSSDCNISEASGDFYLVCYHIHLCHLLHYLKKDYNLQCFRNRDMWQCWRFNFFLFLICIILYLNNSRNCC